MSDQPGSSPTGPGTPALSQPSSAQRRPFLTLAGTWKFGTIAGAIMVALALVGVGLTTSGYTKGPTYWIWLVPVFGLLCIGTAWARTRHDTGLARPQLFRQIIHWLGIAVALGLGFLIRGTGEETSTAAALNAMLLLALGCFLAGVHLDRLFAIVGIFLMFALIIVAKADQYLWLIFVVGGVAIALMLGWRWLHERFRFRKASP